VSVTFERHRWHVVIYEDGKVVGVIGQDDSGTGVMVYGSLEEWENAE